MRAFAELLSRLSFTASRNAKLTLVREFLRRQPDPERGWALASLTGDLVFDAAKPAMIRKAVEARMDAVLFAWSYDYVGDLAETVALVWPARPGANREPELSEVVDALHGASRAQVPRLLEGWLDALDADGLGVIRLKATGLDLGEPVWTADGSAVIVPSRDATGWRLIQSSLDGRGPVRVVSDYGWVSVRIADGGLFGVRTDAPGVWRVQRDGRRVLVADGVSAANAEDWAVARGNVYVLKRSGRNDGDLYSSPLAGGPARLVGHLAHVSDEPGLAVDPKTGAPVFPRVIVDDSDIGLMSLKRES